MRMIPSLIFTFLIHLFNRRAKTLKMPQKCSPIILNIFSVFQHKNTALHMSVLHGHAQVVQTLIQHGANINLTNVVSQHLFSFKYCI